MSPSAPAADWPMAGCDAQRTNASPEDLPLPLVLAWSIDVPRPSPAWPDQPRLDFDAIHRPIVVGRHLIVASSRDDSVTAYDVADGAMVWRFITGGPVRLPPAATVGPSTGSAHAGTTGSPQAGSGQGRVFVGSDDGWLYALDAATGKLLWKFKGAPRTRRILGNGRLIDTWPVRGGPVVADGTVYFAAGIWPFMGVFLHAVDAATGRPVWSNSGDGAAWLRQPHGAFSFAGPAPQGALAVAGDRLLVPCGRALPACYDRQTGALRHLFLEQRAGGHDVIVLSPTLFAAGGTAIDLETGRVMVHLAPALVADAGAAFAVSRDTVVRFEPVEPPRPAPRPAPSATFGPGVLPGPGATSSSGTPSRFGGPPDPVAPSIPGHLPDPVARTAPASPSKPAPPPGAPGAPAPPATRPAARPGWPALRTPVATVPFREGTTLIRAGRRLFVGGRGRVAAFNLPFDSTSTPAWDARIEGTVGGLVAGAGRLFAVTADGRICCFGAASAAAPARPPAPARPLDAQGAPDGRVRDILADSGAEAGCVLVLGAGAGDAARALARRSRLHVVALEPDEAKADALRRALAMEGLYGDRVAVIAGDLRTAALPPYFASLVLAEEAAGIGADEKGCAALFELLHPYHGTAYLPRDERLRKAFESFAAARGAGRAAVGEAAGGFRLARRGGLPGAGGWTHEHADAANTRVSRDALVRAPLGLLWFDDPRHNPLLPRHGHGPQPQAVEGRLIIEGISLLRAVDLYTGRVLWDAPLPGVGAYYNNTFHQPGANATGGNFVSRPDGIYVAYGRACIRLDPATGARAREFRIPAERGDGTDAIWGYLNVEGDYLVGGVANPTPENTASRLRFVSEDDEDITAAPAPGASVPAKPRTLSSRRLFVMDRATGRVRWSAAAERGFRHNAVCAGGGRLYAIDRPVPPLRPPPRKRGEPEPPSEATLTAFDLATGRALWVRREDVFGTWLGYSAEHDVLIESGLKARDVLYDEGQGMRAYRAGDGRPLWRVPLTDGPPMIRGDAAISPRGAWNLLTGQPLAFPDLLTGLSTDWRWPRLYGCGMPAASEHLITFRSGTASFYDLARRGGTASLGGFRSGCTHNLVVAGGLLAAPDYTRTCTCSYPLQASLALRPDPKAEFWTFQTSGAEMRAPIRRLGINLGAPGDRVDDAGTLWLEHPPAGGPSPRVRVQTVPSRLETFRRHATTIEGPMPWVAASGARGLSALTVGLNNAPDPPAPYTVRLVFAEPDGLGPGARVMDVYLQGRRVAENLDIAAAAGGPDRSLIREFRGVLAGADLAVELRPAKPGHVTVLCGVEMIRE